MTGAFKEAAVASVPVGRLRETAGPRAWERLTDAQARAGELLAGRSLWSINSTEVGGGVAEMLRTLLPYTRAAGVDARWLIMRGSAEFFCVTKRIHNFLHGHLGDSGPLGAAERRTYERVIEDGGRALRDVIRPEDVVVLHDPQALGLVLELKRLGATVIWRCHIGTNEPGGLSEVAWDFLWPYVEEADVVVFSRRASVPWRLPRQSVRLIAPSIDPCSVKNVDMPLEVAAAILEHTGLVACQSEVPEAPVFHRADGALGRVRHRCDMLRTGPAPRLGRDQLVVHACRWDRIKDPIGVMRGFVEHALPHVEAHLILAGSAVHSITDDPEEPETLDEVQAAWRALAHEQRARVTIACLPMHDFDENAAIVNALQRHADVIVKKSLEEGFGLGVTEALWKRRAVVASDVGGHRDQIRDQHSGLLVDPADASGFGNAIAELLANPGRARALGDAGHDVVGQLYLDSRQLAEWYELLAALTDTKSERPQLVTRNSRSSTIAPSQASWPTSGTTRAEMHPHDEEPAHGSLDRGAVDPADRDDLTGLWNRQRFEAEFERRIASSRADGTRLALLAMDVDGYRDVIERRGAGAAKGLILSISLVLAKRLHPSVTLARVGGDEFAAVIPDATPQLAQSLADDLCTAVREQLHPVGHSQVHATISIGGVLLDTPTATHREALAAAEAALWEAKTAGADRAILHDPSQSAQAAAQMDG